jgi:hypothetical protein
MSNTEAKPGKQSVKGALRAIRNPHISPEGNCAHGAAKTISNSNEFERGYTETVVTPDNKLASVVWNSAIEVDTSGRGDGVKKAIIFPLGELEDK